MILVTHNYRQEDCKLERSVHKTEAGYCVTELVIPRDIYADVKRLTHVYASLEKLLLNWPEFDITEFTQ